MRNSRPKLLTLITIGLVLGPIQAYAGLLSGSSLILGGSNGQVSSHEAQSSIISNLVNSVRDSIKNSTIQSSNANIEKALLSNLGGDNSSGAPVGFFGACTMGSTGTGTGGALGLTSGLTNDTVNGEVMTQNLNAWNSGALTNGAGSVVPLLVAATMSSVNAKNILGDGTGSLGITASTYSAADTLKTIAVVTNPIPLPAVSAVVKSTPTGQQYQAIKHIQNADISLPQKVLQYVVSLNAPLLPLGKWATQQINDISKGIAPITNGQATVTPSTAVAAAVSSMTSDTNVAAATASTSSASPNQGCNPTSWHKNIYENNKYVENCVQEASNTTGVPAADIATIMQTESGGGVPSVGCSLTSSGCSTTSSAWGAMQVTGPTAETIYQNFHNKSPQLPPTPSHNECTNILQGAYTLLYVQQTEQSQTGQTPTFADIAYGYNQGQGAGAALMSQGGNPDVADPSYVPKTVSNLACPGQNFTGTMPTTPVSQNKWGFEPAAPFSGGSLISLNEFFYIENLQRLSNPAWWTSITTIPSSEYLMQQIAEMNAIMSFIHDRGMVLNEDISALKAQQDAVAVQQTQIGVAMAVRNMAIREKINS